MTLESGICNSHNCCFGTNLTDCRLPLKIDPVYPRVQYNPLVEPGQEQGNQRGYILFKRTSSLLRKNERIAAVIASVPQELYTRAVHHLASSAVWPPAHH